MKKTITIIAAMLLISTIAIAQVPQGMNYQAIARDNSGNPILNTHICMRFTIHSGSGSGPIQYQETDTLVTNGFGLVIVKVGMGIVVQGIFNTIPWSAGNQYMQVEMDMTGTCSSWTDMGASQLLTVPYAMYSASGGTIYNAGIGLTLNGNTFNALDTVSLWNANKLQGYPISTNVPNITTNTLIWDGTNWVPTQVPITGQSINGSTPTTLIFTANGF